MTLVLFMLLNALDLPQEIINIFSSFSRIPMNIFLLYAFLENYLIFAEIFSIETTQQLKITRKPFLPYLISPIRFTIICTWALTSRKPTFSPYALSTNLKATLVDSRLEIGCWCVFVGQQLLGNKPVSCC